MNKDKQDSISDALLSIEKMYGKGSVLEGNNIIEVERLSTGSLKLDEATGGGWGLGRMAEVYGVESSGKSTLCIHSMIEAQKKFPAKKVVMIDTEHAFDRYYAEKLGLDVDSIIISQPDSAEQALEIADRLISTGKISICIVDSIAAMSPQAELEGDMEDNQMGLLARVMSKGLRKLTGVVNKTQTVVIFTNQLREKIGIVYGLKETTPGGNAMKFYASQRIDMRKTIGEKSGELVLTSRVTCKVVKNKLAAPFKKCEFEIRYGEGIDNFSEIIDLCIEKGLIKASGSWYSYEDTKLGQGLINVKEILKDNIELFNELKSKLKHD